MRYPLHKTTPWTNESIVNLDDASGAGTHWVCKKKSVDRVRYFDGYVNLRPPVELMKYFGVQPTLVTTMI